MSLAKYFLNIEDRVPAKWFSVLERGAIVNGVQNSVNAVTVHDGHEFATNDKFIYAENRRNILIDRIFTVSSATATTVTFGGASFSFPDKAYLINLGVDTGGVVQNDGSFSKLEYDAAAVAVYKDPAGDDAWANSRVDIDPGGEVGFWADGRMVWGVVRNSGGHGVRLYTDIGSTSGGGSRGTVLPSTGNPGQIFLLDNGAGNGDTVYVRAKFSDDTYDWLEIQNAS